MAYPNTGGLTQAAAYTTMRPLAGDRLVGSGYERIEIETLDGMNCRGYSAVLGLWLCWEDHRLRLFDAKAGAYLRTHDEEYERAELEAYERRQAELRAILAETRADEEREFRLQETARADEESFARQQAENRRLRAQLDDLRQRSDSQD